MTTPKRMTCDDIYLFNKVQPQSFFRDSETLHDQLRLAVLIQ